MPADPERTPLTAEEERAFQRWATTNRITDVDHPDSFYDYRGFWKATGGPRIRFGEEHFPDTFKQHGHPTFSQESQYSRGFWDGGQWLPNDVFLAQPPMAVAHAPSRLIGLADLARPRKAR